MSSYVDCRRAQARYRLPQELNGRVEFQYRYLGDERCNLQLLDLSASGISFVLDTELPYLEIGDRIERVTLLCGKHRLHGDLLVMHMTHRPDVGDVCGGLFFPTCDRYILELQELVRSLREPAPALV